MLSEQTIENKKNLPPSARRPVLPLAHHSTAQQKRELQCLFSWDLWLKSKLKDSHIHVKENDY